MGPAISVVGRKGVENIAVLLEQAFQDGIVTRLAGDRSDDLLRLMRSTPAPDVVLLDIEIASSIAKIKDITTHAGKLWPTTRILLFGLAKIKHLVHAVQGGAHGYLWRDAGAHEIATAIRRSLQSTGFVVSSSLEVENKTNTSSNSSHSCDSVNCSWSANLTSREREVIGLLARGWTNQQVAEKLRVSIETAKWHGKHALNKLGLKNRRELVYRLQQGITITDESILSRSSVNSLENQY